MDEIMKLDSTAAINIIAAHLLGPCWDLEYSDLSQEEKNTILVNKIYVKYPNITNWPSILSLALKGRIKRWE